MDNELAKITNKKICDRWSLIINMIDEADGAYGSNYMSEIFVSFNEYLSTRQIFICNQLKCIFVVRFMRKLKRLMSIELFHDNLSKFNPALHQEINSLLNIQIISEIVSIFHFYYKTIINTILFLTAKNPDFVNYTKNFCLLAKIDHSIDENHII